MSKLSHSNPDFEDAGVHCPSCGEWIDFAMPHSHFLDGAHPMPPSQDVSHTAASEWSVHWSMAGCWLVKCGAEPAALHDFTLPPNREADARLVGAARDLLAALAEMIDAYWTGSEDSEEEDAPKCILLAKAAIAKATGAA